jgi:hypothetical protein
MNKEIVMEVISVSISDKLSQMMEEMSSNEFLDTIFDKVYEKTGVDVTEEEQEEIIEMVGDKMFPLVQVVTNYVLENFVVKED